MARFDHITEVEANLDGRGLRIGVVMSRFNAPICERLLAAAIAELETLGVAAADIRLVTVPGALELPLMLQRMAGSGKFDGLLALGAVVRGETYHFEVVSNESAAGISQVQLDSGIPIANGVLTTDTDDQALARVVEKGSDCARVVVEMIHHLRALT